MANAQQTLSQRRGRNLAILAAFALFSILLAALALLQQAHETGVKYGRETVFPHLTDRIRHVAHIHVASKQFGAFDVVFNPRIGWVLPQHGNYPASFEEMRSTAVGLAQLQTIEPKTARADWYHFIGVDAPPAGSGTLITLQDEKGKVLAAIVAGKSVDIGDPTGASGLYIRKPGEAQSWLARSVFTPQPDPSAWLDKHVTNVDATRIAEVDVTPVTGPAFTAKRDKPTDQDFAVTPLPPGRELAFPGAADTLASAISSFTFDDVKPATAFNFTGAPHVVAKTFDGLTITIQILPQGREFWATIYADGANPAAEREARAMDAHASGWAYKLPADKGQLLMTTLDSLLKPLPAKK